MGMNVGYFKNHSSDAYTASTMKRMRSGDTGPNGTPSGVLQKGPPQQAMGKDMGNTPNSSPSDTNSGMNYGQKMVAYPTDMPMPVEMISGIPHRPDPNEGGARNLSEGSRDYGFTKRKS